MKLFPMAKSSHYQEYESHEFSDDSFESDGESVVEKKGTPSFLNRLYCAVTSFPLSKSSVDEKENEVYNGSEAVNYLTSSNKYSPENKMKDFKDHEILSDETKIVLDGNQNVSSSIQQQLDDIDEFLSWTESDQINVNSIIDFNDLNTSHVDVERGTPNLNVEKNSENKKILNSEKTKKSSVAMNKNISTDPVNEPGTSKQQVTRNYSEGENIFRDMKQRSASSVNGNILGDPVYKPDTSKKQATGISDGEKLTYELNYCPNINLQDHAAACDTQTIESNLNIDIGNIKQELKEMRFVLSQILQNQIVMMKYLEKLASSNHPQ